MSKAHLLNCNISKVQSLYEYLLLLIYNELTRIKPRRLFLYVIGSIAKNEISCLELENDDAEKLVISDLDLIALTDLISYIKCKLFNCTKIADVITNTLRRKGIETHVSLTLTWPALYKLLRFFKFNTVNFYEMKMVKCSNVSKRCHIIEKTREPMINPEDALNLAISSIADYIFVAIDGVCIDEAVYIIGKRILSLLYALELSLGLAPRGFTDAPLVAKSALIDVGIFIREKELELLLNLANFKKNCNLKYLIQAIRDLGFDVSSKRDLLELLLRLFEKYVINFISYFVPNRPNETMIPFIREYEQKCKLRNLISVLLNVVVSLSKCLILRKNSDENLSGITTMIKYRLRLGDFLRILVLKFFMIVLYRGRSRVLQSPKLRYLGHSIARLWYRYMI